MSRFKATKEAAGKTVCATKVAYGFKVHILCDKAGRKAVNFCFSNGSAADVCFLERLTANCNGSGIGDSDTSLRQRQRGSCEEIFSSQLRRGKI
jgi:hypothetical protein